MRLFKSALASLASLTLMLAAGQVSAHAHLVSSDPATGATVQSPKMVVLHFSERLEPKFSGLELAKADGVPMPVIAVVPENDRKSIKGELPKPAAPGLYKLSWHAVSADGHRTTGWFVFTVH